MKEGTSLNQFFTTVLVMCDDFLNKASRKKVFNDPEIDENGLNLDQTFTKWYKIEASISYELDKHGAAKFDRRRGKYAKKIIYKPVIYDTAHPNHEISQAENNLSDRQTTKRVKEMNIKKAYHYLYTGLNDQILSADISYNAGQLLLVHQVVVTWETCQLMQIVPTMNTDGAPDFDGKNRDAEVKAKQTDPAGVLSELKDNKDFQQRVQTRIVIMSDDEFKDLMNEDAKRQT